VKFYLIDSIDSLSDTRIKAGKSVSLAEEYLADHFPTFPVLPGVLMLEALTQAASFLHWARTDFASSIVVLKEAKNVRYGQFVAPGHRLLVDVEYVKDTQAGATFKAVGTVDGEQAVSARLELASFNLADRDASMDGVDSSLREHHRNRLGVLMTMNTTGASL